jgi:hypothetical protein
MTRRKKFDAPAPVVVAITPIAGDEDGATVFVEENPSGIRRIDLTMWLNQGIDDWVWACASQLRAFLRGRSVAPSTVVSCGCSGLAAFFQFLTSRGEPYQLATLDLRRIEQFVAWLGDQSHWGKGTQITRYTHTKAVLVGLQARGIIPGDRSIFPRNPFPKGSTNRHGEMPLSPTERNRLAVALRNDLVAIHKGRFNGRESEALTIHALALALRTGLNPTPLLELRRHSLKPHPFMPTMMRLESFKRRGYATHLKNLRFSRSDEQSVSIPMNGVAIFRKVLERTQFLADSAPNNLRDRVWLLVAEGRHKKGATTTLSSQRFIFSTQAFVGRHDLRADDGGRLRLNASRLRKTMESRLWHLSNGDLFAVAAIMGHTPAVADNNYLACTREMRKNATFVGEALADIYRGKGNEEKTGEHKVIAIRPYGDTPVGSCKDSLYGDKAPKDGTHCADFFSCFSCRSYAIVGSKKDLHRLFSFYWFLDWERQRSRSREWTERFMMTTGLIDNFTLDKFDPALVAEAKEAARIDPLKFWRSYQIQEGLDDNGTA